MVMSQKLMHCFPQRALAEQVLDSFRFVLISIAGWMNQRQLQIIDYLREENRVLREQLGGRQVRFNDDQRRRLAANKRGPGRPRTAREIEALVLRMADEGLGLSAHPGRIIQFGTQHCPLTFCNGMGWSRRRNEAGRRPGKSSWADIGS
jgi:hypothetical protein